MAGISNAGYNFPGKMKGGGGFGKFLFYDIMERGDQSCARPLKTKEKFPPQPPQPAVSPQKNESRSIQYHGLDRLAITLDGQRITQGDRR